MLTTCLEVAAVEPESKMHIKYELTYSPPRSLFGINIKEDNHKI
jgi:hypothetical protein